MGQHCTSYFLACITLREGLSTRSADGSLHRIIMPQSCCSKHISPLTEMKTTAAMRVMGGKMDAASSMCTAPKAAAAMPNCCRTKVRRLMPCAQR